MAVDRHAAHRIPLHPPKRAAAYPTTTGIRHLAQVLTEPSGCTLSDETAPRRNSSLIDGGCARWWLPMVRGLLVSIGEFDQLRLAPFAPREFHSNRQPIRSKSAWNYNGRQARLRGELAIIAHLHLADQVGFAAYCRIRESLDMGIGHGLQKRFAQCGALDYVRKILRSFARFDPL